jgi:competence protein ComEC
MRLVYLALGWVTGMLMAANHPGATLYTVMAWALLSVLAGVALWLVWPDRTLRWPVLVVVALTLGGLRFALVPASSDVALYNHIGGLTITGLVVAEPDVRDDRVQLVVEAASITRIGQTIATSGRVLVEAPRLVAVQYGDTISATGQLITPGDFDTFSYRDFLGRRGVFSMMRGAAIEVVESGGGHPLAAGLLAVKAAAGQQINRHLPEPQAGLLTGILLGNERGIAPQLSDDFNAVGAAHVVAISGFNMVILSGVVMALLKRLRLRPVITALLGISVIVLYTLLVGANAAVLRAAAMSSVVVIGGALGRKAYLPASMAFVTVLLSLHDPMVLWDVSFQLSLFAVLGIALFADPLSRRLNQRLPLPGIVSETLVVTLAVQITTLPIVLLYFGRLSLVLLAVNLLIVPPQALLLILGLLATMTAFVLPPLAQVLYWFDMLLLGWTIGVVRLFAQLPFASVDFYLDPRLVATYYLVLIGGAILHATQPEWVLRLAGAVRRRAVVSGAIFAGAALAALFLLLALSRPDGRLHVWLLDVGHSNAVLVQSPGGAHILVDGGRYPSRLLTAIGDRLPFNDREIELLVLTQPDEFDIAAVSAVLDRYRIGAALTSGQPNLGDVYRDIEARLQPYPLVPARAGYTVELDDGLLIEVLHPQRQPTLEDGFDDQTLVLRLRYGEVSFLLAADASTVAQTTMLEAGIWPLATVLQLPRHGGARTLDAAFLQAVQPSVAVVQVDPANRLGDPEPDTLALLGDVPVFRTDTGGTIHLISDGVSLWVAQD